jgi:hypothetical protein
VSCERKIVRDAWNILMLSARRHVQDKDTRENSSMGQGVRSQRKKSVARFAFKEFFEGSVGSSTDPELCQRRKYETHNAIKRDTTGLLACEFLRSHRR